VLDSVIDITHVRSKLLCDSRWAQSDIGTICGFAWNGIVINNCAVDSMKIITYLEGIEGFVASLFGSRRELSYAGGLVGHVSGACMITDNYVFVDFTDNMKLAHSVCALVGRSSEFTGDDTFIIDNIIDATQNGNRIRYGAIYNTNSKAVEKYYDEKISNNPDRYYVNYVYREDFDKNGGSHLSYRECSDEEVATEEYLFGVAGFDPMLWEIMDGSIVKR
jgi:hypothetical protein